jgi:hypothetical protein
MIILDIYPIGSVSLKKLNTMRLLRTSVPQVLDVVLLLLRFLLFETRFHYEAQLV